MPKIAVLPHLKVRGWDGIGAFEDCGIAQPVDLEDFVAPQDTDAMAVCYLVPGEDAFPRLNTGALPALIEAGQEPLVHWVFLDIDNPGHVPWPDLGTAAMALMEMTQATGMGGYTTRAGLRLVAPLDPPLPASVANSWLEQFGAYLTVKVKGPGYPHPDIDPASYEWTRLMRLPRAKRDGQVLDSIILLDDLTPIDPHSFGFPLTAQSREVGDWGDAPPEPVNLTWEDWKHSIDMPWTTRGRPVPEDETGSRYGMARTALARIAARGKICDPHILASYLWESVLSTAGSSLDIGELWKLACWVADRQATDVDEDTPHAERQELWPEGVATVDEWAIARKALSGNRSRIYASLKDGLPLHSSKTKYEEYTYRTLRYLAEDTELPADSMFRLVRPSVEQQRSPMLEDVWSRCQDLVEEREDDVLDDEDRTRRAFIEEFPLTLACPHPGTPLFQLDTSTTPYSYRVTSDTLIDHDFERYTRPGLPFEAYYAGAKVRTLLATYGGRVEGVAYAAGLDGCRYNKEHSLMDIGTHRLAQARPAYHEDVAKWLELLGGTDPGGLKDWLSCVTYNQDQPLCAVYIEGAPGIGKSLLGKGLASLWGSPPVDYNRVMNSDFNGQLIDNPVLFADEGVVIDRNNSARASLQFRDVVSSTNHTIRALYKNPLTLRGSLRVLICANDDRGLPFKDSLGADGIDAIVQRVMYIKADPQAADYLREVGGREGIGDEWAPDDNTPGKIAEHLLWLRDNHEVASTEGGRFMVVGKLTDWHREFGARQGIKPNVLRVIYAFLQAGRMGAVPDSVKVRDDKEDKVVWVHPTTVLDGWDRHAKGYQAKPAHIKDALKQLAREESVKSFGGKSVRVVGVPYQAFIDAGVCEVDDLEEE